MMWSQIDPSIFEFHYKRDIETRNINDGQLVTYGNPRRYHTWDHIKDMYQYLEENNVPYSRELDVAVAGHDVVYDNLDGKEFRSAVKTIEICDDWLTNVNVIRVAQLIMATERHISDKYDPEISAIIRADLHQLQYSDPKRIKQNFKKIFQENKLLYLRTPEVDLCNGGIEFMTKLKSRIFGNMEIDRQHLAFWLDVIDGIFYTIDLYHDKLNELRSGAS